VPDYEMVCPGRDGRAARRHFQGACAGFFLFKCVFVGFFVKIIKIVVLNSIFVLLNSTNVTNES